LSREVILIDENGDPLGKKPLQVAQGLARDRGLDLVEVGPNNNPPVCKILDFGKFKYDLEKKKHRSKSNKAGEIKEVRLGVNTEEHDFNTQVRKAEKFLSKGHKIRITVKMSGRENIYADRANHVIERFKNTLGMKIEQKPTRMGTRISALLIK